MSMCPSTTLNQPLNCKYANSDRSPSSQQLKSLPKYPSPSQLQFQPNPTQTKWRSGHFLNVIIAALLHTVYYVCKLSGRQRHHRIDEHPRMRDMICMTEYIRAKKVSTWKWTNFLNVTCYIHHIWTYRCIRIYIPAVSKSTSHPGKKVQSSADFLRFDTLHYQL